MWTPSTCSRPPPRSQDYEKLAGGLQTRLHTHLICGRLGTRLLFDGERLGSPQSMMRLHHIMNIYKQSVVQIQTNKDKDVNHAYKTRGEKKEKKGQLVHSPA